MYLIIKDCFFCNVAGFPNLPASLPLVGDLRFVCAINIVPYLVNIFFLDEVPFKRFESAGFRSLVVPQPNFILENSKNSRNSGNSPGISGGQ